MKELSLEQINLFTTGKFCGRAKIIMIDLKRMLTPEQIEARFAPGELVDLAISERRDPHDVEENYWQLACDIAAGNKPMPF